MKNISEKHKQMVICVVVRAVVRAHTAAVIGTYVHT